MADTTTMTVRLDVATKERLEALARSTKRSASLLAAEAIEAFVDVDEWQVEGIEQAVAEADAGGAAVPHGEMVAWLASWGSEDEIEPPEPRS